MKTVTLEEMLDGLKDNTESELEQKGLSEWSIEAAGFDFADEFKGYGTEDLEDLRDELLNGAAIEVTIDLSTAVLTHIEAIISDREAAEDDAVDEDYYEMNED